MSARVGRIACSVSLLAWLLSSLFLGVVYSHAGHRYHSRGDPLRPVREILQDIDEPQLGGVMSLLKSFIHASYYHLSSQHPHPHFARVYAYDLVNSALNLLNMTTPASHLRYQIVRSFYSGNTMREILALLPTDNLDLFLAGIDEVMELLADHRPRDATLFEYQQLFVFREVSCTVSDEFLCEMIQMQGVSDALRERYFVPKSREQCISEIHEPKLCSNCEHRPLCS